MILKPGTGTNPYYARKHGHEIPNALDRVLAGLCPEYQPTGATDSVSATEMLCKGQRVQFAGPEQPAFTPPAVSYGPSTYSNETFGVRTPVAPAASAPEPAAKMIDVASILAPGHGWSEQDSQRQLQALKHCAGGSVGATTRNAFDQSVHLADRAFSKSGWAAGFASLSLIAGVGAVLSAFSNPALAAGLAGGAFAGAGGAALLAKSASRDHNNSQILSDMGRRIDAATRDQDYECHGTHGNYVADFTRA